MKPYSGSKTESAGAGLLDFPIRRIAAAVVGKPLGVQPRLGEAVHLPRLAE
jgi:hypothetical protein